MTTAAPTRASTLAQVAATVAARFERAGRLADAYAIATIESACEPCPAHGATAWDTRPMFSEHEHCGEVLDMNADALRHAIDRRLVKRDPDLPHLVHVMRQPQQPPHRLEG